jgi:hypothetical protein
MNSPKLSEMRATSPEPKRDAQQTAEQATQAADYSHTVEYWQGHDVAVHGVAERWEQALTRPIPAPGVMNEPLESLYRRTESVRAALAWALGKDTGSSSKCIAAHLTGNECDGSHPSDPDDLGRCLRLLRLIPELREAFPRMTEVSAYWAALVPRWTELAASMDEEVGIAWERGRSAPKTYALMRSLLDPISRRDPDVLFTFGDVTARRGTAA